MIRRYFWLLMLVLLWACGRASVDFTALLAAQAPPAGYNADAPLTVPLDPAKQDGVQTHLRQTWTRADGSQGTTILLAFDSPQASSAFFTSLIGSLRAPVLLDKLGERGAMTGDSAAAAAYLVRCNVVLIGQGGSAADPLIAYLASVDEALKQAAC